MISQRGEIRTRLCPVPETGDTPHCLHADKSSG